MRNGSNSEHMGSGNPHGRWGLARWTACAAPLFAVACASGGSSVNDPAGGAGTAAGSGDGPALGQTVEPFVRQLAVPGSTQHLDLVWVPAAGAWVTRTEITWDQYLPFCSWETPLPEGVDATSRPSEPLEVEPYDHGYGKGARPAVGVSWRGAQSFADWLSAELMEPFGLPTQLEWDAMTEPLWTGVEMDSVAWHSDNTVQRTAPVGTLEAASNGLHDLLGNLWEYGAEPFDPNDDEVPVLRGGSYRTPPERLSPSLTRAFDYDWLLKDPTFPPGRWWVPDGDEVGFRLVSRAPGPDALRR